MARVICPFCLKPHDFTSSLNCKEYSEEAVPNIYVRDYNKVPPLWLVTIGFSRHGKTTYLAALTLMLENISKVWHSVYYRPLDQYTIDGIRQMRREVIYGGLPSKTDPGKVPRPLLFNVYDLPESGSRCLVMYDVAGETYDSLNEVQEYVTSIKEVNTTWFIVSLSDLQSDEEGKALPDLFHMYLSGMENLRIDLNGRNLIVVYTKGDTITAREFRDYLMADPLQDLTLQDADIKYPESFSFHDYIKQMKKVSDQLEDYTRRRVKGGAAFINMVKAIGMNLVFCVTSALGESPDPTSNRLSVNARRYRVLDPFLWTITLESHLIQRAMNAYEFFQKCNMDPRLTVERELPDDMTDLVVDIKNPEIEELFGICGPVLVRCFKQHPDRRELGRLQKYLQSYGSQGRSLVAQDGRKLTLYTPFAFIAVENCEIIDNQVINILGESNQVIIPLDDTHFEHSDSPLQVLRKTLERYLGLRDLYSYNMPVSGRRFFGHEKLLIQLTDQVHDGQFLGIYGLRKMGKTSLLHQLRDEKLHQAAIAYIDLQASGSLHLKNATPLYWELERDLYQRLNESYPNLADLLRLGKVGRFSDLSPEHRQGAGLLFLEDIRSFLDVINEGKHPSIKRLVIMFDELERILPVAGQAGIEGFLEFFGLLRGLSQTEQYHGIFSCIVAAANTAISERGYWNGQENPVFAFYKPVFLPLFTEDECSEMIVFLGKGMRVYWEKEAIKTVFAETGGHPFLTRLFCSQIVEQQDVRPLTVTVDMVKDQIIPFIRDKGDKFEQITELLNTNFPQELTILEQIALNGALSNPSDNTLRHLLGYQLIRSQGQGQGYYITLNSLCNWLRRRAGVRDTL